MPSKIVRFEDRAEIITARGDIYTIDLQDVSKVEGRSWCDYNGRGYAGCKIKGEQVYLHRYIVGVSRDMQVDHIDGNTANNRRSNLRICTHQQNTRNTRKHRDSRGPYKGVSWRVRQGRWCAQICASGRKTMLGLFSTAEEAKAAYDQAAKQLFGEFQRAKEHE